MNQKNQLSTVRHDLIPVRGLLEVDKVLTSKLEDHSINEWRNGLDWNSAISILKKHLYEFELVRRDNAFHCHCLTFLLYYRNLPE